METLNVQLFANITNSPVIKMPDRNFPGVVIQGDSLAIIYNSIAEIYILCKKTEENINKGMLEIATDSMDDTSADLSKELRDIVSQYLRNYENTLTSYGVKLPYYPSLKEREILLKDNI